jgi:osmotically-inducible protein OsmY
MLLRFTELGSVPSVKTKSEKPMFSVQSFRFNPARISSAMLIAMGVLSGCTSFSAGQKCGLAECATDAQVTAAVRASLDQHPEFGPPGQLRVATLNHVVYLNGSVANDLQLAIAQSAAAKASGDAKIVNSIAVMEK